MDAQGRAQAGSELAQTPEKLCPICSHVPLPSAKILSQLNWLGKMISCDGSLRMKDLADLAELDI